MTASAPEDFGFPVVELPAEALGSPEAAITFLMSHLASQRRLAAEQIAPVVQAILTREELGSTAIGRGVAIPHAKSDAVNELVGLVGVAKDGVRWPGLDELPVRFVFLLISPAARPLAGLRALEALSRKLREEG